MAKRKRPAPDPYAALTGSERVAFDWLIDSVSRSAARAAAGLDGAKRRGAVRRAIRAAVERFAADLYPSARRYRDRQALTPSRN